MTLSIALLLGIVPALALVLVGRIWFGILSKPASLRQVGFALAAIGLILTAVVGVSLSERLNIQWLVMLGLPALASSLAAASILIARLGLRVVWQSSPLLLLLLADLIGLAAFAVILTAITEQRATRVSQAIQRYHIDQGAYPPSLEALSPRYLLLVPGPLIMPGQGWCYDGDASYYRFGSIYRQYFSSPISARLYASAGALPGGNWMCDQQAEQLRRASPWLGPDNS